MIIFIAFIILVTIILAFEKQVDHQIDRYYKYKRINRWEDQID